VKTREFPGRGSQLNVLGGPLLTCSDRPLTGFFRDGCCNTSEEDMGSHTVCVILTAEFLEFSKARGNDLSTPHPEFDFPGLQPGQRWCLCAARWLEAWQAGKAPYVSLNSTPELDQSGGAGDRAAGSPQAARRRFALSGKPYRPPFLPFIWSSLFVLFIWLESAHISGANNDGGKYGRA